MEPLKSEAELDRFLQCQHNQGQDEGEGAFTLDPVRARQQLGRFQLAHPGLYVVKAVQAAVMAGAELVTVKVSRRALTLEFECEDGDLTSAQKVRESLLSVHSLGDSPVRHLVVAISSAASSGVHSITWTTPQGGVSVTETGVEHLGETGSPCSLRFEKRVPFMTWLRGTVFVDEIRAIDQRCGWGPCRVVLDGRQVLPQGWELFKKDRSDSLGLWPTDAAAYRDFLQKNLLERHLASARGGHLVRPPMATGYRPAAKGEMLHQKPAGHSSIAPWLLWPEEEPMELSACSIAITTDLVAPARVAVIKHGAFLETKSLEDWGHPGSLVLLDGSRLATDLTEFRVVENEALHAALKTVEILLQATAKGMTQEVLVEVFEAGGLPPQQSETKRAIWCHWFQNHALPQSLSQESLLDTFFPPQKVSRSPLSASFEATLREAHAGHLPPKESILLAYSDALLGESADGFAATSQRLCWKTAFFEPNYIHWDDVEAVDFGFTGNALNIGGSTPSFTLNPPLARCLFGLLRTVRNLGVSTRRVGPAALRAEAIRALGKPTKLYYYPHIPLDKMTMAGASFGQPVESDEPVVLIYDSTLFGKCDNGVLLTLKRIAWCNLMEKPTSFLWEDLARADLAKVANGIKVKDKELHINQEVVRDGFWNLMISQCSATAQASGATEG